jgi:hypothetical protein
MEALKRGLNIHVKRDVDIPISTLLGTPLL